MLKAAYLISLVLFLVLITAAWYSSTFYWVFLVPLLVSVACQCVALWCKIPFAEKFFSFSDMAYYLIIGAVIGLGTRYLPELDTLFQNDAELSYDQAVAQFSDAQIDAQAATELQNETASSLATLPSEIVGECIFRQITENVLKPREIGSRSDRLDLRLPDYPPGCDITLAIVDIAMRATGEAIAANKRRTEISEIIKRGPNPSIRSSDFLSPKWLEWILLKLFPTLVLSGVMFKVGKTTLSIRKLQL